jgi:hypothetical protein
MITDFAPHDLETLRRAKARLENPSLAVRLADLLASPVEKGLSRLPRRLAGVVQAAARKAIETGLRFAVATMKGKKRTGPSIRMHKLAALTSGAAGGAFGLAALPLELPVSTVIMLRSISDIARSEGEDLKSPETILNCLQVFALGGRSEKDDAADTAYYAVRAALSKAISEAAEFISSRGLTARGAPVLVRLIAAIASRFGAAVSEKAAAMSVPAIGAIGGGLINTIFMDHFQKIAQSHFAIRRLERLYGAEAVLAAYRSLTC